MAPASEHAHNCGCRANQRFAKSWKKFFPARVAVVIVTIIAIGLFLYPATQVAFSWLDLNFIPLALNLALEFSGIIVYYHRRGQPLHPVWFLVCYVVLILVSVIFLIECNHSLDDHRLYYNDNWTIVQQLRTAGTVAQSLTILTQFVLLVRACFELFTLAESRTTCDHPQTLEVVRTVSEPDYDYEARVEQRAQQLFQEWIASANMSKTQTIPRRAVSDAKTAYTEELPVYEQETSSSSHVAKMDIHLGEYQK